MGNRPRTLLIDNYDSFTYNLVHELARATGVPPVVIVNDEPGFTAADLRGFDCVVISPGPGHPAVPADFGICADVLRAAAVPVLGICLGHQGLALAHGGAVGRAPEPVHGRPSQVRHDGSGVFSGLSGEFPAVRYHSLAVTDPGELRVTARSADGVIMGMEHPRLPRWGVQFHPESILTAGGSRIIENFVDLAGARQMRECIATRATQAPAAPAAPAPPATPAPPAAPVAPDPAAPTATPHEPADAPPRPAAPYTRRDLTLDVESFALPLPAPEVFTRLYCAHDTAVWLDGNQPGNPAARFSIMGAPDGPLARTEELPAEGHAVPGAATPGPAEEGPAAPEPAVPEPALAQPDGAADGDVFAFLDRDLAGLRVRQAPGSAEPPFDFRLGWVGTIGFERQALLAFLDRGLVIDHDTDTVYLLAFSADPGRDAGSSAWFSATRSVLEAPSAIPDETGSTPNETGSTPNKSGSVPNGTGPQPDATAAAHPVLTARHSRAAYLERVRRCQELEAAGETYEVCLTNMLSGPALADPLAAYLRLRADNPAPFGAYLRFGDTRVLSTSPERFVSVSPDGRAESRPIKGTRPRGPDPDADLRLHDQLATAEKDRSENLKIVDLVRHDLGRTAAPGSVRADRLFEVETHATVHQLVSTVTSRLAPGATPVGCVRACFPPGSMTGAPKVRTMEILRGLEGGERGFYSGAIGYFSPGGGVSLSVAIRTLVSTPAGTGYGVGGAVVALSDPDEEWQETVVKARPLLRLLGLGTGDGTGGTAQPWE